MKNKFEKTFDSGMEMLDFLQAGKDLYNPETDAYVFVYNEDKAIAYYSVSKEDAKKYAKIEADTGEYWGSNLGVGGYIYENQLSENYDKSKVSSRDFCNEHFNEGVWVKTTDYFMGNGDWIELRDIYRPRVMEAKLLPGYTWVHYSDGSGHLQKSDESRVLEYDLTTHEYKVMIGSHLGWNPIPNGYLLEKFKEFAEEKCLYILNEECWR